MLGEKLLSNIAWTIMVFWMKLLSCLLTMSKSKGIILLLTFLLKPSNVVSWTSLVSWAHYNLRDVQLLGF